MEKNYRPRWIVWNVLRNRERFLNTFNHPLHRSDHERAKRIYTNHKTPPPGRLRPHGMMRRELPVRFNRREPRGLTHGILFPKTWTARNSLAG